MHKLKPYAIKGGGGGREIESHVNVLYLGAYGPLEREMGGGGGRVRQTYGTEMEQWMWGGGRMGVRQPDSQKQRVHRQETERETKRETDGHTTERACINIHHHPHQTPSQTPRS